MDAPRASLLELPPAPAEGGAAARHELDVTIVVPVETGDAEVGEVVAALGGELEREGRTWECILVFDGVRGAAWQRAQELSREHGSKVRTIAFKSPFGESVCLSAALERARGRTIITSPQYVQVDPVELEPMLAAIDAGADMVTPWRRPRIDPVLNRLQSAGFNWVIRQMIRGDFHDLNCYLRAIRREVLEGVSVYGDMYRFLPVIAHRHGYDVVEVPVRHLKEWGTAGFYGLGVYVRRFLDVLGVIFLTKFTLKPLRFFGSVGALFSFMGLFILTWLAWQRIFQGAGLYNRPVLLLGVMLFILGVQVIGFGLVGEIIIYSQARNLREYRIERFYE